MTRPRTYSLAPVLAAELLEVATPLHQALHEYNSLTQFPQTFERLTEGARRIVLDRAAVITEICKGETS